MRISHVLRASLLVALSSTFGCMADVGHEGDEVDTIESVEAALNASFCNAKPLEVIVQGRENRFGLDGQQVALNAAIPMDRICKQVSSQCRQICADAQARAVATGIKGFQDSDPVKLGQMGELADNFNAVMGLETNFKALGAPPPAAGDDAANDDGAGAQPEACNAKILQVIVQGKEHRFGFDNRQVALNPAIPMANICQRVSPLCLDTCNAAKAEAIATGIKGFSGDADAAKLRQMGTLADAFNAALGNQTNFETIPIGAAPLTGGNADGAQAQACVAKALQVVVRGREHRFGFDGRQVALNAAIPMTNICQRVAAGACRDTCDSAKAAAIATGIKGFSGAANAEQLRQMGSLADDFNAALGIQTNFEENPIFLR